VAGLKIGDEVYVSGPFGDFFFDEKKHKNLVMIAGGIGVTPFLSILQYAADKNLPNKMYLLYSNRTVGTTSFLQEIKNLEARNPNMKTLFSVTDERTPIGADNFINERFDGRIIKNFVGDIEDKSFFLCGPVGFMNAIKIELLRLGVSDKQIFSEEFSMIPDSGFWLKLKNLSYATGFAGVTMLLPLYFIYNTASGSVLPPFYDQSKIYNATKSAYEQMISDKNPVSLIINNADQKTTGVSTTQSAQSAQSATKADDNPTGNSNSVKTVKTENSTNVAIQTNNTNPTPTPTPTTHASTVVSQNSNSLAINNSSTQANQSNSISSSVPQPVTSASGVVSAQTNTTPTTQNSASPSVAVNSNPAPAPQPVTSASGVAVASTPTPTLSSVSTQTSVSAPTPTPTNTSRHRRESENDD
jgi:hypothetical protein